ncbi:Alkyltransferase-like protein 1 [Ophidiomyces ophidiicola]|nr:Alkyltransferase-like protein 1 [Ophidiomyces ophidiicola]KAI1942723.1 Alkyltransferase-like protein 1 [Ophidiomyces ophidiicola]KAI1964913.1 Alkyltransferase-like protein 1 [Ophidiomyces ophidiicola]
MPRTDEAEWWFNAVYAAVQEIPPGKVTSYGHIARLLGEPQRSRQVGMCLKYLPPESDDEQQQQQLYHNGNVPWQRVINSKGMISPRGPGSAARQAAALEAEGIVVERNSMGEYRVDFADYGWFPRHLPGHDSSDDEGEEEAVAV